MKRLTALFCFWFILTGAVGFASGVQIDFLLAGFRDPGNDSFLDAGLVYTYSAGTTASKSVYMDSALTTPSTNPIVLDAYGRALRFAKGKYKFVIKTSGGTTLWTLDNLEYDSVATLASKTANPFGPTMSITNFSTPNLNATLSANLNANGYKITSVATPTSAYDVANMQYVASEVSYLNSTIASQAASASMAIASLSSVFSASLTAQLSTINNTLASLALPIPLVGTGTDASLGVYPMLVGSGTWITVNTLNYTNSSADYQYLAVTMQAWVNMEYSAGAATDTSCYCFVGMNDTLGNYYAIFRPSMTIHGVTRNESSIPFTLFSYVAVAPGETKTLGLAYKGLQATAGSITTVDGVWVKYMRVW